MPSSSGVTSVNASPRRSAASRAADAMDVGVGRVRHVEVDDMRDAFDMQTTHGDIGGNHDVVESASEALERRTVSALAFDCCAGS